MKTIIKLVLASSILLFGILSMTSCGSSKSFDSSLKINTYTRDTTSGTRDGFFTAIGFKDAIKDDSLLHGVTITDSNGTMIQAIKNDTYGIGYISMSSLDGSGLKGLNYNSVAPTTDNVINGSYELSRNFNYIIRNSADMTERENAVVQAFIAYMNSKEGLAIIKSKDGILTTNINTAQSFSDIVNSNQTIKNIINDTGASVQINLGGSTSVEKIATALTSAFKEECKVFNPVHNHTGSSDAYKGTQGSAKDGTSKLHIGFLSRELSSSEVASENTSGFICKDGIVVVVNSKNPLENITKDKAKTIYESTSITWASANE